MVFVTNDINAKINSIEKVCFQSNMELNYIAEMWDFEKKRIDESKVVLNENNPYCIPQTNPLCAIGSKDMLRLVRALDLVYHLLNNLGSTTVELSECTRKAYNGTISKYHGYLVRKSVSVACYLLPYRKNFFKTIRSSNDENINNENNANEEEETKLILQQLAKDILPVYQYLNQSFIDRKMDNI